MSERKHFIKKELNKDDYKKDIKIAKTIKRVGGIGTAIVPLGILYLIKSLADKSDEEDSDCDNETTDTENLLDEDEEVSEEE